MSWDYLKYSTAYGPVQTHLLFSHSGAQEHLKALEPFFTHDSLKCAAASWCTLNTVTVRSEETLYKLIIQKQYKPLHDITLSPTGTSFYPREMSFRHTSENFHHHFNVSLRLNVIYYLCFALIF